MRNKLLMVVDEEGGKSAITNGCPHQNWTSSCGHWIACCFFVLWCFVRIPAEMNCQG